MHRLVVILLLIPRLRDYQCDVDFPLTLGGLEHLVGVCRDRRIVAVDIIDLHQVNRYNILIFR